MSLRPDGSYRCDRCGVDVGNAGVDQCTHVMTLNPDDPGDIQHFHFCLPRPDPDNEGQMLPGCRDQLLTDEVLANFHEESP
jgi:hypothetical protein